ncbi:MAG: hypothetical protein PHD48_12635 [Alphaproteobacteria bacterium]|nr:hypothetical protein [Alphaproteobacteria bacterium]
MKLEVNNGIVRGVPLAVLVTFLVQGAAAVWWVSAKARDTDYLEQKVTTLETVFSRANETQGKMLERLVRIEERTSSQTVLLERIDKQLSSLR